MTGDELEQMLFEVAELDSAIHENLEKLRPQLEERKRSLEAHIADIEKYPQHLFMLSPPYSLGGYAVLTEDDEKACGEAVVAVLRKRLKMICMALLQRHRTA